MKNFHFILYCRNILYLCKRLEQVTDNYEYIFLIHILLGGIIILLVKPVGSEPCA